VLYVGADYLLAPQLLLGTLVQFDDTEQDFDQLSQKAGTTGWMAGPYATLRLPSNLYFQARAAWGRSDNEIRFAAGPEDSFDAERWLVRGTLLGQWRAGPWQLQPRASVGYIEEDQESYTTANNVLIPSQTVSLGQAKAGSQVAYRYRLGGGTVIEPSLLLEGIWNFHQDAGLISIDDLVTGEDVRARAEAGVMLYTFDGIALGASVSYDGIGSGDYEAIGGRARVRMPFN
jgi:outer membrane autotransporter protein